MPELINPMQGKLVANANGGGVPAGAYTAEFVKCEHLPVIEADPMTGKGGRKWACNRFSWRVIGGEHDGQTAYRETPANSSLKSKFAETLSWLLGKMPEADYNLQACVGKRYLINVSQKLDQAGRPTNYTCVTSCITMPQ